MNNKITISPNPFTQRLSVEVISEVNENLIVTLTNSDEDRIIRMFSWHVRPGANTTSVDGLSTFPPGTYCIQIKNDSRTLQYKEILQKEA